MIKIGRSLVKLKWSTQEMVVAWSGVVSQTPGTIGIPSNLAACAHLEAGGEVKVSIVNPAKLFGAVTVSVEPVTVEDWEMVDLNAGIVEAHMMNQVATVKKDTIIPIWINESTVVRFMIKETNPTGVVKLVDGTEVIVAPKLRHRPDVATDSAPNEEKKAPKPKKEMLRVLNYTYNNASTHLFCDPSTMRRLRWRDGMLITAHSVAPTRKYLERYNYSLRLADEDVPSAPNTSTQNVNKPRSIILRVFGASAPVNHALIHINTATQLNLHLGSRFLVTPLLEEPSQNHCQLQRLLLKPLSWGSSSPSSLELPTKQKLVELVNSWTARNAGRVEGNEKVQSKHGAHAVPLSNGTLISLGDIHYLAYCNIVSTRIASNIGSSGDDERQSISAETRMAMQERSGSSGGSLSSGLLQLGQLMPQIPGMEALQQLEQLREAGERVLDARTEGKLRASRQAAELASIQESSDDIFMVPSDALFSDDTLDIGPAVSAESVSAVFPLDYFLRTLHQPQPPSSAVSWKPSSTATSAPSTSIISNPQQSSQPRPTGNTAASSDLTDTSSSPAIPATPSTSTFIPSPYKGIQTLSNTALLLTTQDIGGMDAEISIAIDALVTSIGRRMLRQQLHLEACGMILITGQHGCGKSMLARALSNYASKLPTIFACTLFVNCSDFSGMKIGQVVERLELIFADAIFSQPSVLCLDDLETLVPAEQSDSPQAAAAKVHYSRILACLISFIDSIAEKNHQVTIIATAENISSINANLTHPSYVQQHIALPSPNMKSRIHILQTIIHRKGLLLCSDREEPIDECSPAAHSELARVALRTDGYLGADLEQLVDRAVHAASVRLIQRHRIESASVNTSLFSNAVQSRDSALLGSFSSSVIHNSHYSTGSASTSAANGGANFETDDSASNASESNAPLSSFIATSTNLQSQSSRLRLAVSAPLLLEAQEGFVPISLRGVALSASASTSWEDIGGLEELKRNLRETIEWPTRYGFLFKNSPIRHRSGILLFGPSGCGKTLVASSVAKECGLNFISVKGPELLNKYIGASEQSVRDVFSRAQAASPCVLFFDEFDSIAPRRGHDNTGVTDRVVNQFLTELDGVEGLTGVYVLAATSRPDLIDAALLRPGRLDKSYYIGYPDIRERELILKAVARKMKIHEDVQFAQIAAWAENCTGADLQALLYNSQLEAIHERLDAAKAARDAKNNLANGNDAGSLRQRSSQLLVLKYNQQQRGSNSTNSSSAISSNEGAQQRQNQNSLSQANRDALLKNLDAVHESLLEDEHKERSLDAPNGTHGAGKDEQTPTDEVVVTMAHIKRAFASLTPSSSPSERQRNERTYSQFMASKGTDFADVSAVVQNQKATLA